MFVKLEWLKGQWLDQITKDCFQVTDAYINEDGDIITITDDGRDILLRNLVESHIKI